MTYKEKRELNKKAITASDKIKLVKQYKMEGKTAKQISVIMDCHVDYVRKLWNKGIAISKQEAGVIARREQREALAKARTEEQVAIDAAKKAKQKDNHAKAVTYWLRENQSGVTKERYDQMFSEQDGKCAICGKHQDELKVALAADHCHSTLQIRGLLCTKCNLGLGYFDDDASLLQQAINYLQKSREIDPARVLSLS